jgi:tetratricopeptide (TPR) repeat protein
MQLSGDLFFYWHIRGKNISAREYAAAFLDADVARTPSLGRAGALITAGLASWVLGQFERSSEEWTEAHRIAKELAADRELCISAFFEAAALIALGPEEGLKWASESIERSRAVGFTWGEALASTIAGILRAVTGDVDKAEERYAEALAIQQQLGDEEGAGLSLGGLAQLAAIRGDLPESLELYRQSLAAFEAVGDRAEEAREFVDRARVALRPTRSPAPRRPAAGSRSRKRSTWCGLEVLDGGRRAGVQRYLWSCRASHSQTTCMYRSRSSMWGMCDDSSNRTHSASAMPLWSVSCNAGVASS